MLLFFKRLLVVVTAVIFSHTAHAFAVLGPFDTWQVSALGYDPQADGGDLGGPKNPNANEEFRWNLPVITYAFDQSFITFFGTNGIAEVEKALDAFNREMINLDSLTDAQLRAKPTEQKRIHLTAQALGLFDLKTVAMGLIAEQLGLASATRWNWALRSRAVIGTITNYAVIKRNYDPFTLKPSSYVNGRRFTYEIKQFPAAVFSADFEDAVEMPVDQTDLALAGSEVSSMVGEDLTGFDLKRGEYFSGLTQDDVGGLRYLYRRQNVNLEPLPIPTTDVVPLSPAIRVVDRFGLTYLTGFDAFTFLSNAAFTPASNLVAQFPGLEILSTNVVQTNIITTNFILTNFVSSTGLRTNTAAGVVITNLDLFTFSEASRTNDAVTLVNLYPGLIVTDTRVSFVEDVSTVFSLTNGGPFSSVFDPPVLVSRTVTNVVPNFRHQYANIITNYVTATTDLEIQNIGLAPWSTPQDIAFQTNKTRFNVRVPSGGFYILDRTTNANLVGYTFYDDKNKPLLRSTNIVSSTNGISFFTNLFTGTIFRLDLVNQFTQVASGAYPILLNTGGSQQIVQVTTTNSVPLYSYTFGNLFFFDAGHPNTNVTLVTTIFTNGVPRIIRTFLTNDPGSFVIIDPNLWELAPQDLYPPIRTTTLVTNNIFTFVDPVTGAFITQDLVYFSNSVRVAVFPVTFVQPTTPTLRAGVNTLQFRQQRYFEFYDQANSFSTNFYNITAVVRNSPVPQVVRRIAGPDIVFSAGDLGVTTGGFPVGWSRNINFQVGNALVTRFDGGPGIIVGGANIAFSTVAPSYINQTPGTLDELNAILWLSWGSFDAETLTPRIYPEDVTGQITTLQQLEAIALGRNPLPPR